MDEMNSNNNFNKSNAIFNEWKTHQDEKIKIKSRGEIQEVKKTFSF